MPPASGRARAAAPSRSLPAGVKIRSLTPDDWPAVERLFGPKGACGGCWCMWWRLPSHGRAWREAVGEPNRRALRTLIHGGEVHSVLAVRGREAVAWCNFGPRESFAFLVKSRALARPVSPGLWSVVCFYLPPAWRRRGLGRALLEAATERAFALGAAEVEGFPVVPHGPGATIPAAFAWTGLPAQFEAAGFKRLRRAAGARPIYVRRPPARRRPA